MMDIFKLEYSRFYDMDRDQLLNYLKNELDFNDNTYPYLNHNEVLNMDEEKLRTLIIEIVDEKNFDEILKVSKEMRNNIRGQDIGGLG